MDEKRQSREPTVTAVITTYNRADMVGRAIQSVLDQTHKDFELIVVDDCSTDNTGEIVRAFQDTRIRYIRHERNRRLSASRNTGMKAAQGKYIAFLDDDDEWLPIKIEKQLQLALNDSETCEVYYCGIYSVLQDGTAVGKFLPWRRGVLLPHLAKGWTPPASTPMFRKTALEQIGGHDETLKSCIDHDVWMKMAAAGYKADFVPEALVKVYYHEGVRMTGKVEERLNAIETFLDKWRDLIIKEAGHSTYMRIRRDYYQRTYGGHIAGQLIRGGNAAEGRRYLWKAIKFQPTNKENWARYLIVCIGGKRLYRWVRTVWQKTHSLKTKVLSN